MLLEQGETAEQFDLLPFERSFETITLTRCGSVFAKVDPIIVEYASRFTWSLHKAGAGKIKHYGRADRCPVTGLRLRLYLHHLVADVFGIKPEHPACKHLDHRDGDGLNCCAYNLVWRHPIDNRWGTARWR